MFLVTLLGLVLQRRETNLSFTHTPDLVHALYFCQTCIFLDSDGIRSRSNLGDPPDYHYTGSWLLEYIQLYSRTLSNYG